ncbi:MAG: cytochrome c oxidase subunit 3 family protein [Bdellovibrionaceae bacterium]|nr:cytochrome c oxidase subunit 3 family protein [Pseudobdellovibrionaceae bacterium]
MSSGNEIIVGGHKVAHHFDSAEQEFEASKLGIWLFLCTEILMFGGLFVGYVIFHNIYPEMFAEGAKHLDWRLGSLNTVVLLLSSFTMVLSIYYAQTNQQKKTSNMLLITFLCGLVFMVIKAFEYYHKFHLGLYPGSYFSYEHAEHANLAMYFSFYFLMTGLHGTHVLVGMFLIAWLWIRSRRKEFNKDYYTPLEVVGLFWHLVDIIWIYLFPLLYLVG